MVDAIALGAIVTKTLASASVTLVIQATDANCKRLALRKTIHALELEFVMRSLEFVDVNYHTMGSFVTTNMPAMKNMAVVQMVVHAMPPLVGVNVETALFLVTFVIRRQIAILLDVPMVDFVVRGGIVLVDLLSQADCVIW